MSGKGGSSFGTLLFSIPLAAIPLMAIFGIPQFSSLVASPERVGREEQRDDDDPDDRDYGRRRSRGVRIDDVDDDGFHRDADFNDRGRSREGDTRGRREESHSEAYDLSEGDGRIALVEGDAPLFPGRSAGGDSRQEVTIGEVPSDAPLGGADPGPALTWQSAAQRFQELGITSYHLEPGSAPAAFLFVCAFCPAANPNVMMRFESEAAEPLDAVGDVLAQIDRWQERQSAAP